MKYAVLVGDGMADWKIKDLGHRTPLECAATPNMDKVASQGEIGLVRTVPEGFPPGSDVANLSIMGYDPRRYYTGRSPLEAASMGVELEEGDVAFRCNLVTLSDGGPYEEKIMVDYSADEITSAESRPLIEEVNRRLGTKELVFYPGFGFRHLLVWKNGSREVALTPPHDIPGRVIGGHLPAGKGADVLVRLMKESSAFLPEHPVNRERQKKGLRPANSIWFWGHGVKPSMESFFKKYGLKGAVISAVDLIKGIGSCAGLEVIRVEGVTGTLTTNYRGKVEAALGALAAGADFVYVHAEAPDAASHRGELENKIRAIEMVDEMLGLLLSGLKKLGAHRVLVLPDHPTPLAIMTHSDEPVPFAACTFDPSKNESLPGGPKVKFCEDGARQSGLFVAEGHRLMDCFINGKF